MFQTPPELRELQLKCLEILDVVHKICMDNDIKYSLCGGSVVGAHLYNGFIPWDDDIDLMMTRENYNLFTKVCANQLPKEYSIVNYQTADDYSVLFTKVMDERTTLVQEFEANTATISGVFLDITCYDKIPTGYLRVIDIFFYKISQWAFSAKNTKSSKNFKDRLRNIWLIIFGSHPTWLFRTAQQVFEYLGHTNNYAYSELFGAYANTIAYSPFIFENYKTILFEGKNYMIVKDYLYYLETRYNRTDFHEPVERQVPPHYSYVNLELPYRKYLRQKTK